MLQTSPWGGRNSSVYMSSCPHHTLKKAANFAGDFDNPLRESPLTRNEWIIDFSFQWLKGHKCLDVTQLKPFLLFSSEGFFFNLRKIKTYSLLKLVINDRDMKVHIHNAYHAQLYSPRSSTLPLSIDSEKWISGRELPKRGDISIWVWPELPLCFPTALHLFCLLFSLRLIFSL